MHLMSNEHDCFPLQSFTNALGKDVLANMRIDRR
jgi:hypothetical protein